MTHKPFKLPDIGEGTAEAELVAWHVEVGQTVAEDQPLCEVMTDKATVEITAPFPGKVVDRTGMPGDMLPVGSVILLFDVSNGASIDSDAPAAAAPVPELVSSDHAPAAAATRAATPSKRDVRASPAVRKRAADLEIDLRQVIGSGAAGRVRQSDVDAYLAYTAALPQLNHDTREAPHAAPASMSPRAGEGIEEIPVIGLRRRISERMQDTKRRIPHFSYVEEIDVTQLELLREQLNDTRDGHRPKLTPLPFLVRALTQVLPEFPNLNALYDDAAGVLRRHAAVHAGIATQTPSGLVVTVLRDAARHDIWGVASELSRLSNLARAGRASPTDLSGSTITITSLGPLGGIATTPIINSPEVAIVGMNKIVERPIVSSGQIRIAKTMNLSSSFDHRVIDGWEAASFIQRVKTLLETPAMLFVGR